MTCPGDSRPQPQRADSILLDGPWRFRYDDEGSFGHFGALDHSATVWVDGRFAVVHDGGRTPFSADITALLEGPGPYPATLRAEDDPQDPAQPRAEQDGQRDPHSIRYPQTTGIWQTVWPEKMPRAYLERIGWTPQVEGFAIGIDDYRNERLWRPERATVTT